MTSRLLRAGALVASVGFTFAHAATFNGVDVAAPLPPRSVFDTHFGVKVEDPYRFLEDTSDPLVKSWMREQSDATHRILEKLPGRDALLARIREIDAAVPAVIGQLHRDTRGGLTYLKRAADENQFKLYHREREDGAERLLADPEPISKAAGTPHAIGGFTVSPDGRRLTYTLSSSGTEIGTLHVIDLATGRAIVAPIDRIRWGAVSWLEDGSGFFYIRLAPDFATRPRVERYLDHRTYFRALAKPDDERLVFGPGVVDGVALDRGDTSYVTQLPERDHLLAIVQHGVLREITVYHAPLSGVMAGKPVWERLFDANAGVHEVAASGRWLYLRSVKDAPRFHLLRLPLDKLDLKAASVVVTESDGVLNDIAGARDALYFTRREGVEKRLYRLADGDRPTAIALPVTGNVRIASAHSRSDGAVLALGGWTRATRHYALDERGRVHDMKLVPIGRFDAPEGIVAREVKVKSHDGVDVPVSILMAKSTKLDGRAPLLLYGYGAYGNVEEPGLSPRLIAWLERGGVYAIAHVRGGGVHGDAWRRAGWKTTKPNTWKDGIAVAEWLIAQGYTSPDRLSIFGGSAGGIFVGRAITERPDLFSAAVIAVGNVDSIRSETRANGIANIPEYGTVTKEDEFRGLLAMSPYANVKPGTPYPAVLFEHGVNDSRVDVWMSLKLASRLAASTTSKAPVLLRLDYDSGHGAGATRDQVQRQIADRWSFLLWQSGATDEKRVRRGGG
ncbi:MAG TPA: prolyl oligopeptidase family serine peptidase [Casimicrobiaceae bacterium]|nr:prolyl oligopeptidase family serine peptidase [Casimicrobiaceae bacterium]